MAFQTTVFVNFELVITTIFFLSFLDVDLCLTTGSEPLSLALVALFLAFFEE
jgi:hypothetical protein